MPSPRPALLLPRTWLPGAPALTHTVATAMFSRAPHRSRRRRSLLRPVASLLLLPLSLLTLAGLRSFLPLAAASPEYVATGCKPRNRDLRPDSRVNIGVLHRPDNCFKNTTKRSKVGDQMKVHYEGRFYRSCELFDSSRDRGDPFEFTLGQNSVIKGWEIGLLGMCKGERRKLIVPSDSAYGDVGAGQGEIPSGATLIFDVELREDPRL